MGLKKKISEVPAEEKIKEAARRLFTEKGFEAVKTRDIAAEAGINLALLNYYFRSKENLFDIVMTENFQQFVEQLIPVMGSEDYTLEEILEKITESYIEMLKRNPDLPFFIMNQMRRDSSKLAIIREKMSNVRKVFLKRLEDHLLKRKFTPSAMGHLMMNFMGLMVFPFVAQPMLMQVNGLTKKDFDALMEERKKLIPVWLKMMMTTPKGNAAV